MKIHPGKAHFCCTHVEFIGHRVSRGGISVMPEKVEKFLAWERPATVRDVRSFLGITGYYQRFIHGYADLSCPPSRLIKKSVQWQWGSEQEGSFQKLIAALTSAPILKVLDWSKDWIIDCDASNNAIGKVLSQKDERDEEHLVYYHSRLLSPTERNYSMTDRECLTVITVVKKFRVYILGKGALIRTDNGAVRQLLQQPKAKGRRARRMAILSEFDFSLEHQPGTQPRNADAMSRLLPRQGHTLQPDDISTEIDDSYAAYAMRAEVDEDHWYRDIIIYLKGGSLSHLSIVDADEGLQICPQEWGIVPHQPPSENRSHVLARRRSHL